MKRPTQVAAQFLVVGFGRSFIARRQCGRNAIAVQEISSGISAADDRGYNELQLGIREFTVDEANDLQEY